MLRRILIGDNERVLVIRKRRFAEILEPGERWIISYEPTSPAGVTLTELCTCGASTERNLGSIAVDRQALLRHLLYWPP